MLVHVRMYVHTYIHNTCACVGRPYLTAASAAPRASAFETRWMHHAVDMLLGIRSLPPPRKANGWMATSLTSQWSCQAAILPSSALTTTARADT